ncbi:MAG TPA: hypothetical protein VGG01_15600 [Xanthobacteraceae bacterium]|jgi:hypothetical protein
MTRWDPQIDLSRLLDALAREILAASDDDVRRLMFAASVVRASADEVRRVIEAVLDDGAEAGDRDARPPHAVFLREQRPRQH